MPGYVNLQAVLVSSPFRPIRKSPLNHKSKNNQYGFLGRLDKLAIDDVPGFGATGCSASGSTIVFSAASLFSTGAATEVDVPAAHGSKSSSVPQSTSVSMLFVVRLRDDARRGVDGPKAMQRFKKKEIRIRGRCKM